MPYYFEVSGRTRHLRAACLLWPAEPFGEVKSVVSRRGRAIRPTGRILRRESRGQRVNPNDHPGPYISSTRKPSYEKRRKALEDASSRRTLPGCFARPRLLRWCFRRCRFENVSYTSDVRFSMMGITVLSWPGRLSERLTCSAERRPVSQSIISWYGSPLSLSLSLFRNARIENRPCEP